MCNALGYKVNYLKIVEIILSGVFVAGVTPSSAGGEPVRLSMLHMNRIPLGKATAVIVGERLLDAFLVSSSLPFALYIMKDTLPSSKFNVALLIASLLALMALSFFIYGLWKPEKVKNIIRRITGRIAPLLGKHTDASISHLMEKVDREVDLFHESIWIFISVGKKKDCYGACFLPTSFGRLSFSCLS
ncbi:flippase-like domain-containing protein [Methanosarcina barkeri]|uniref:flippase-like domain-containing protein n=1 Tax=Methanosarcina barkeri TaxID=2208 RepID=UPI0024367C1C|nr:flippase-like domain-containing protein [Methanosarcina barkeri]